MQILPDVLLRHVDDGPRHGEGAVANGFVAAGGDRGCGKLELMVDRTVGLDAQHRVNRRYDLGDVSHIGRATGRAHLSLDRLWAS